MFPPLKYFRPEEFACPCCGQVNFSVDFARKLDVLRMLFGAPLVLESAGRCVEHNKEVGGVESSRHLFILGEKEADAVDIHEKNRRWELVRLAFSLGLSVGVYSWGVHLDNRPTPVLFWGKN